MLTVMQHHYKFFIHLFTCLFVYLGVGHIHPRGVEAVFDLLPVIDLQQVIASKLHFCELLIVFEEIHRKCHLAGCACSCKREKVQDLT